MASSDFGVARLTAQAQNIRQLRALHTQIGSSRLVNGLVDAAPAEQRFVGGVNNRVDLERGDVCSNKRYLQATLSEQKKKANKPCDSGPRLAQNLTSIRQSIA